MGPYQGSRLETVRRQCKLIVPPLLLGRVQKVEGAPTTCVADQEVIKARFPSLFGQPIVSLVSDASPASGDAPRRPLRVGCVLSGGQAAGGHNCICGLFDYVTTHYPGSTVYGFLGGPKGIMTNSYKLLDRATIDAHRNSGGFTMLASGRDKIETADQFDRATATARLHDLDGLVVIGGDDSNTNACLLAEHYKCEGLKTSVIGLPKTIDGDLKNEHCETSFGFDTAAKLYAELVGNIMVDCMSSGKYFHIVRLMGREASHLTLEVALQTQPNMAFVGEEVRAKGLTLSQIVEQMADLVIERRARGLEYGVILVPEGLVEFIPEVGALMRELNEMLAGRDDSSNSYTGVTEDAVDEVLTPASADVYNLLPHQIRSQLLLDRDPHGNVQVAKIESERLLGALLEAELARRAKAGAYAGKLSLQYHYFGYEGRCALPSAFDSNYCYALGLTAAALISQECTGVMACLQGLVQPPTEWRAKGVPLTAMLAIERRKGKDKPVIRKALVELEGAPFRAFAERRAAWRSRTTFAHVGPVQYEGALADAVTMTLRLEQGLEAAEDPVGALAKLRRCAPIELPTALASSAPLRVVTGSAPPAHSDDRFVQKQLPHTHGQPRLEFVSSATSAVGSALVVPPSSTALVVPPALSVGIVFCGRQCPGAHNIVAGLSHFLVGRAGPEAKLWGFVHGTEGLFRGEARELPPHELAGYLNSGGMHLLGRTSDVIRSPEQFEQAEQACAKYRLDGLVLVGGPVSNSDTALVAEHFASRGVRTRVVGVPATIDGDLHSLGIEASIGFDTACRVYASLVGNLATDAASARKYWYFVRMMGRSPSHITLECANLTQPNVALIGEEIEARRLSLAEVVAELADVVEARAREGKHFGVALIPEGLIEFIPQMNALLKEVAAVRRMHAASGVTTKSLVDALSPYSSALLNSLPAFIRKQLLLETQASDDKAQLNQIETERLFAELVRLELDRRHRQTQHTAGPAALDAKFAPVCFYLGYQARSSLPSAFDCSLAATLGHAAAALVAAGASGYLATAHCLAAPTSEWRVCGLPLSALMSADRRAGAPVAVVRPSTVDLGSTSFRRFALIRERIQMSELYCNPGPMQLVGALSQGLPPGRVLMEHSGRAGELREMEQICSELSAACWPGCPSGVLTTCLASLRAARTTLHVLHALHAREASQTTMLLSPDK
jgi:diphosphate--fructose-6-phosphate 1-phosphotransferase